MSIKSDDKFKVEEEPVTTIKQKCAKCLRGPNLIKTIVVLVCTAVVVQQISSCITKLIHVPITTYTHFDFNKTIMYPSLTFCREPPYRFHKMEEYGLYAHPRWTSTWMAFNFSAVTLEQLWEEITYTNEDFFVQYGLDGYMDNVTIKPTMGFVNGRCHTLTPKQPSSVISRGSGYSVTLQHRLEDVATSTSVHPPGYHVFVHYAREPFTEVEVYNGGLVDYFYISTGETVDVKLTVDQYNMLSDEEEPCTFADNYSANNCTSQYVWDTVGKAAGCSGPWMVSELPRCSNYNGMKDLITSYMNTYGNHACTDCPRFCTAFLYNAFVAERQKMYTWDSSQLRWTVVTGEAELQSQIYVHFNSMMVSVYEERYNYDWNLFVSDLGGSIGFLLGLSVIGLMTIFGKVWSTVIRPFIKIPRVGRSTASVTSKSTLQADRVQDLLKERDRLEKCNEWNLKNLNNVLQLKY